MTTARGIALRVSFPMYDSSTGLLKTGLSPAATVSLDGGNYGAVSDAPVEIQASGTYELTLTAGEMTADLVTVKVTAVGALAVTLHITTDSIAAAITAVDDYVDSEVAAIKAVTDLLPDAGGLTTIQADLDDLQARLPAALVSGRMNSSVGAVANGAIAAAAFATGAFDAIFTRALSAVEGSAPGRSLAGAIAKLVNKVVLSGGTLSVKQTDDTTDMFTQTAGTDAAAEPVISLDTD